jgi:ubiquitin carboxyl-terminal hydrolase 9/24
MLKILICFLFSLERASFYYVLKINKLTMTTLCFIIFLHVCNAMQNKNYTAYTESQHEHALLLQNSVQSIPNVTTESTIRTIAQRLGSCFHFIITKTTNQAAIIQVDHIHRLQRIALSMAASNTLDYIDSSYQVIHDTLVKKQDFIIENDNKNLCREALEVFSLALSLLPGTLDNLNKEKHWHTTIYDLLLLCNNRFIRQSASEQFFLIALRCSSNLKSLNFFIQMLFTCLQTTVKENSSQSSEYFQLLCRLLNCAYMNNLNLMNIESLLNNEVSWLRNLKDTYLKELNDNNKNYTVDEVLLDGHLGDNLLIFFLNSLKIRALCQFMNQKMESFVKKNL